MANGGVPGVTNGLLSAYYDVNQGKNQSGYSTDDQKNLAAWGRANGYSDENIQIAQIQFLADIVTGRKPKLAYQQIDFFVGPLLSMIKEGDKPGASVAYKQGINQIRQDPILKSEMIRMQSRSLYETAEVMMNYYKRFNAMKESLQNEAAVMAANPGLTHEMYQKALTAVSNLSRIYENKYAGLTPAQKGLFDKLLRNQKYFSPENQALLALPAEIRATKPNLILTEESLTAVEYKESVQLMSAFAVFEEKDVQPLVDAMSLYQCLMAADLLKKSPKENQFAMATFSELFQAAMRHPMLLESLVKAAGKVKSSTAQGPNAIIDDATYATGNASYQQTREMVLKANYGFGDNFMLDGAAVNEFLILQKEAKAVKLDKQQKELIDKIASVMQMFREANNQYYLNPSAENMAKFKTAFQQLQDLSFELGTYKNQEALNSAANDQALIGNVYAETKKEPSEIMVGVITAINEGVLLYIRRNEFDTYRGQQVSALMLSQSQYNYYQNDEKLKILLSDFKAILQKLLSSDPQTDQEKVDFFKKVVEAKELIELMKARTKEVQQYNREQGIEEKILTNLTATDLVADAAPVPVPASASASAVLPAAAAVQAEEPRPSEKTFGNIKIDFKMASSEERRAIKDALRVNNAVFMKKSQIPVQFQIVETKKALGIKTGFVVKDDKGQNVLHIVVEKNNVRIRELTDSKLTDEQKLQLMHHITQRLKKQEVQPTVSSTDINKVRSLNEISINEGQNAYLQTSEERKAIRKQIESNYTSSKETPVINIKCAGNSPEQIRDKFQSVVADGSFVPNLVWDVQPGEHSPMSAYKIDITTEAPLVAIKQYEAALNAGMTPVMSAEAKKKVDAYVIKQLDNTSADKQINITVPADPKLKTGMQVLERIKQASKDGLMVHLGATEGGHLGAADNLKEYIATLKRDAPALQYDLPLKHPYAAVMVTNLLSIGLLPNRQALDGKMDSLRQIMREDALQNNFPVVIDSGNIARDFVALKSAYEDLGRVAKVSEVNLKALRNYAKNDAANGEIPVIDLKNISAKEQIACAQRFAQLGIYTRLTTPVVQGTQISISSKNPEHARILFERYVNQGFKPHIFDKRVVMLSESGAGITIEGKDPKIIFERMSYCAQEGLKVLLNPEQKEIMRKFSEKHSPNLMIHGHSWQVVKHNIELANTLGMVIKDVTKSAQAAYVSAQMAAKNANQADMPRIDIVPIQKTQSRFLRGDIMVDDRNKTKLFAELLLKKGINISMANLSDMRKSLEEESKKTKWFGLSKTLTAKAQEAQRFLSVDWQDLESNVKSQTSQFIKASVADLAAVVNQLEPPVVKGAKPAVAAMPARRNTFDEIRPAQPQPAQQRQAYTPAAVGAPQAVVLPVAAVSAGAEQAITVEAVLEAFKQIHQKAREDHKFGIKDTYANPGRVADNADKICGALGVIQKRDPAVQIEQLQKLLVDITNNNAIALNVQYVAREHYVVDDKIKEVAKGFAERIDAAPIRQVRPF